MYKTSEGYVAQCTNNRGIIVGGDIKAEVKSELKQFIHGYAQTFPDEKHKFFKNDKMVKLSFEDKLAPL